jgi:tRNA nucleotidyltransferase (CCA-adding enzyme)
MRVPEVMREFASILAAKGFQCWLVGGAVRDMILGKESDDFDVATDARPEEVMGIFRSVIPTGIKHGTVTVRFKGIEVETTTFRTEEGYSDGRHPDTVEYAKDISEDLSRRDFTMNAMALDCSSGELRDPFGGTSDIASRSIRAVGDPRERFSEDGLRPLRAVRFASVLGFSIQDETLVAIPPSLGKTALVSSERVRDELSKILEGPFPLRGLELLRDTGLLGLILPELDLLRDIEQSPPHAFNALDHSFLACAGSPPRLTMRWAALLHDSGKAEARTVSDEGIVRFIGHEAASARIARIVLMRLKYPLALVDRVVSLVALHMAKYEDSWTDAAVRRLIARAGKDMIDDLLLVLEADEYGLRGESKPDSAIPRLRERITALRLADAVFSLKELAIGGDDLLSLGFKPGKRLGTALAELLDAVLEDPGLNEKERLISISRKILERDGQGG